MFVTVSVVLAKVPIAFQHINEMELFDASSVDLEQPRWIAKAITRFACRRTEVEEKLFITKLVKLEDAERLTAQFGLAILIPDGVLSDDEIADLKLDIARFAPRVTEASASQKPLDFDRPDRSKEFHEELEAAVEDCVKDIRRELGGKRITMPIDVRMDDRIVAHIAGKVIRKLDTPPEPLEDELVGTAKKLQFQPHRDCELIERRIGEDADGPGRRVRALIGTDELFDALVALGRANRAATFTLKSYSTADRPTVFELLSIEPLNQDLELPDAGDLSK